MASVRAPGEDGVIEIELCRRCHMAWLDEGEWERLPKRPRLSPDDEPARPLPDEAVEAIARADAERIAARDPNLPMPETYALEWATGLYRDDGHRGRRLLVTPVTGVIAVLVVIAIAATLIRGSGDLFELGPGGLVGIGIVGLQVLLHAWVAVYYLFTFGSEVEARIGSVRTVAMLVTAAAAGTLANAAITPDTESVVLGAIASTASLAAFFALAFPKVPFQMLVVWLPVVRWVRLSARTLGAIYAGYAVIVALPALVAGKPSAAAAFVASAGVGLLFWVAWRDQLVAARRVARVAADSVVVRS